MRGEVDKYRLPFLIHLPALSRTDVDDMPFWLWEQCRAYVDERMKG